jgi:TATA-binding protein-associated factor Taf7
MVEVSDFIDQVIDQDFASAAPTFKDIMGDVMNQSLEQEKVKIADQMFDGIGDEAQTEPDVYELDLDAEEETEEATEEELDAGAEEAMELDDDEDYQEDEEEDLE